jgi:hypothetical protein
MPLTALVHIDDVPSDGLRSGGKWNKMSAIADHIDSRRMALPSDLRYVLLTVLFGATLKRRGLVEGAKSTD